MACVVRVTCSDNFVVIVSSFSVYICSPARTRSLTPLSIQHPIAFRRMFMFVSVCVHTLAVCWDLRILYFINTKNMFEPVITLSELEYFGWNITDCRKMYIAWICWLNRGLTTWALYSELKVSGAATTAPLAAAAAAVSHRLRGKSKL